MTPSFAKSFPNWQHLGLWMLTVATVASPWYLKNLAFTGNPFYPFFFGGRNWDAWRDAWFTRWGTGLLQEPVRLLTAPWDLGVLASESSLLYDVSLSPLLLGFMPLLLLLRRAAAPWTASALWVALVAYGGWLLGAAQSELLLQGRLLLPALPLLAAALAVALAESRRLALPLAANVIPAGSHPRPSAHPSGPHPGLPPGRPIHRCPTSRAPRAARSILSDTWARTTARSTI